MVRGKNNFAVAATQAARLMIYPLGVRFIMKKPQESL